LLDNLVSNAIKYNRPHGTVTVSLALQGNEIALSVADTGIGISEKHREFLFNEFFRAHTDKTDNISGTGLGLAICKRITSELGGAIEVDSTEGVGTTFRVLLPVVTQPAPDEVPAGAV
jgi:two-component system phosphate regulon sensor histidine kinase PhoR